MISLAKSEVQKFIGNSRDICQLIKYLEDGHMPNIKIENHVANHKLLEIFSLGDLTSSTTFEDKHLKTTKIFDDVPFLPNQRLLSIEEFNSVTSTLRKVLKSGPVH